MTFVGEEFLKELEKKWAARAEQWSTKPGDQWEAGALEAWTIAKALRELQQKLFPSAQE